MDGAAAARLPDRGRCRRGRARGGRALVRRLSRAPLRLLGAGSLPRRAGRARPRLRCRGCRAGARSRAGPRLRAGRAPAAGRLRALPQPRLRRRARRPRPRRPPQPTPASRPRCSPACCARSGRTYIQYWLYYPDSNTAWAGSDEVWEHNYLMPLIGKVVRGTSDYPGFHEDDWEGYQVRIDPDGRVWARASSHRHYQGCKEAACRGRWMGASGWTRVSRGSHAGHLPASSPRRRFRACARRRRVPQAALHACAAGVNLRERTSTAEGLRLIPLESRVAERVPAEGRQRHSRPGERRCTWIPRATSRERAGEKVARSTVSGE